MRWLGESCSNNGPWCCDDLKYWADNQGLICKDCIGLGQPCTSVGQCCQGSYCADSQTSAYCQSDAGCTCAFILP